MSKDIKVTELPYMGKPKDYEKDVSNYQIREDVDKRNLSPYEKKAEKFESSKTKGGGGGGGGVLPLEKMLKMNKMNYKAGGKVSSASKRADGCAIKGKTKGRIV